MWAEKFIRAGLIRRVLDPRAAQIRQAYSNCAVSLPRRIRRFRLCQDGLEPRQGVMDPRRGRLQRTVTKLPAPDWRWRRFRAEKSRNASRRSNLQAGVARTDLAPFPRRGAPSSCLRTTLSRSHWCCQRRIQSGAFPVGLVSGNPPLNGAEIEAALGPALQPSRTPAQF